MHPHRTPVRSFVAFALSLAFVGFAGAAHAQVDPTWDHYKVYQVQPKPSFVLPIVLSDQFGVTNHNTQYLDLFANPVEKVHGPLISPIHDPRLHYMWWKIDPETPVNRTIIASNQFGEQTLVLDRAVYLLNPALKNEASDIPLPIANHYKCYSCSGQPVNTDVFLTDQFYARPATVLTPRFFCTPTKKVVQGTSYPIIQSDRHYVVYDITPGTPIWQATMRDQFIQASLSLSFDHLLAVPTDKIDTTPADPSTWGRIKAQYR
jgi:hypothetical protein